MKFKLSLLAIAFIALLSITGCSEVDSDNDAGGNDQAIEGEKEDSVKDNEEVTSLPKPPSLTIEVGEEMIKPVLGTYSWGIENSDGTTSGIEAQADAPPELVKNIQPAQVTSDTNIELNFEARPQRYEVRIWEDNSVISTSDVVTLSGEGEVIYDVLAYWEQGTASYAFSLHIE